MTENKENAYFTCPIAEECYSNYRKSELYHIARKTNKPEDWENWGRLPMVLIDCFNMECLMREDYKQAMENLKKQRNNNLINK